MDDDLNEAAKLLRLLGDSLPDRVDPGLKDLATQTRFHVICLRDVISHRIKDLSEKVLPLYQSEQRIPAFLVTRAIIESVALLYHLHQKIVSAIKNKDVIELKDWLKNAIFGSRNTDTDMTSPNILTALDSMDKEYSGIRVMYDQLSEFCHPNYGGVLASYSHLSEDKSVLYLGPDPEALMPMGSFPFVTSLSIACKYYKQIQIDLDNLQQVVGEL
jgi:hypothetical protein